MAYKLTNFFRSALSQQILAADLVAYISDTDAADLPALGASDVCRAVLWDNVNDPEIIDITDYTLGTLTIERAKESTVAQDWGAGTKLAIAPTAALLESILSSVSAVRYSGVLSGTNSLSILVSGDVPAGVGGEEAYGEIANDNTGAVTLQITNGTDTFGPKGVVWQNGDDLIPGELIDGFQAKFVYNLGLDKFIVEDGGSFNSRVSRLNDAAIPGSNRVLNANFDFWTAGTSFSSPVTGTTVADNWYVEFDGTIGTYTVSRQAFTLGQTTVPGDPKYFLRWDHTSAGSGSTKRRLAQKIADVTWRNGRKAIIPVWLKADSARTVSAKILQNFGSGGSPSSEVTALTQNLSLTTSWTKYDLEVDLPSVSGKTLGTSNDGLIIAFDLPVNTTMTIDFATVGMYSGVQSPFFPDKLQSDFVPYGNFLTYLKANDGSGSGIDADLLDGYEGSAFGRLASTNTWALAQTFTVAPVFGDASGTRSALGLGTAALATIGTLGDTVPKNNTANTFSANQVISGADLRVTRTGGATAAGIYMDRDASQTGYVYFRTGSTSRWTFGANGTAESGSNVGSDFAVAGYSDAGSFLGFYFLLIRSSGIAQFPLAQAQFYSGSASAPGIGGYSDTNTGIEWGNDDTFYFVNGGARRYRVTTGSLVATGEYPLRMGDGSVSAPVFTHNNDPDNGLYRIGTNDIGYAIGGALCVEFTTSGPKDASGNLLASTGKQEIPIPAGSWVAPTTNGAEYSLYEPGNGMAIPSYLFDQTTDEYICFSFPAPKDWNEGTLSFRVHWTSTAAGDVIWGLAGACASDDDPYNTALGTAIEVTDTRLSASGDEHRTSESSPMTLAGTPAEGDVIMLRLYRKASSGSDTIAADVRLTSVSLYFTTNQANAT